MKLFTVGPVEMYPETLKVAAEQLPYFRTPEFSGIMLENEEMFKASIHAPKDAKTVFLTASGTAAMEAAVMNCFTAEDKLLVINGGGFGKRFAEICALHRIPYEELCLEFGEVLTGEQLAGFADHGCTGLLVNLHETSTGQLYDIRLLTAFCREHGLYLIVDAISAYGADEIDFERDGIDALIVSSQKALALSPGLAIVAVSDRLYRDRVMKIQSGSLYFDFKIHIENLKRGQTPFTPAVGILLELHERLLQIQEMGIERLRKQTHAVAGYFRDQASKAGFLIPKYPLSNALTPVLLESCAKEMYTRLKDDYGLVVTPNGGALENTIIRVGHLGNVVLEDYEELLKAMKAVQESL
ncbi:MAG: alanine--glyoxylate aminotransferase family protein [Lachnospiraceae bacterium]|nr:alanine--glyoxylate aminotransferase family protein [Lachnospiraceae bacterium]